MTALHLASSSGHVAVVRLLIQAHAAINLQSKVKNFLSCIRIEKYWSEFPHSAVKSTYTSYPSLSQIVRRGPYITHCLCMCEY